MTGHDTPGTIDPLSPIHGDVEKLLERLEEAPMGPKAEAAKVIRTLRAENSHVKASLAGQSAHLIDLELAVERLAANLGEAVMHLRDMTVAYDTIRAKLEALEGLVVTCEGCGSTATI